MFGWCLNFEISRTDVNEWRCDLVFFIDCLLCNVLDLV